MAGTVRVVMRSRTVLPGQDVSVHTDADWGLAIPCRYEAGQWVADLSTVGRDHVTYKFVVDGFWLDPPDDAGNLRIGADGFDAEHVTVEPTFSRTDRAPVVREQTQVSERFFPVDAHADRPWDVVVIGSGMGGGVLAHQLATADRALDVLVLDAGGYLFPTHVGNLPRRHRPAVDKSVWDLWETYQAKDYDLTPDSDPGCDVRSGITFGGRSIFWGGTAPRLSDAELQRWPAAVHADLMARAYDEAENLLRVAAAPDSSYQRAVLDRLDATFDPGSSRPAPMAVEYDPTVWGEPSSAVPSGVFSTAALLLEDQLAAGQRPANLAVHLLEPVVAIDHGPNGVTGVRTRRLADGQDVAYLLAPGGRVVLAAGSVHSPALVQRSGLPANGFAGRGLTDHPVYYCHFTVPPGSEFSPVDGRHNGDRPASSKTLTRRPGPAGGRGYNLLLELGADFNQSRFVSPFEFTRVEQRDGAWCEAVFLLDSDLRDDNTVAAGETDPVVSMRRCDTPPAVLDQLHEDLDRLLVAFSGTPEHGADPLDQSSLGAVAHEVGTLRLGPDGDAAAVVDENLAVRGVPNLHVCDLSVFPTSPASNPSLTLAALAIRLADHLLAVLP